VSRSRGGLSGKGTYGSWKSIDFGGSALAMRPKKARSERTSALIAA
jgi:hypothetical protein